ncbi:Ras- protein Rab-12 [Paramecium bursaria]
MQKNNNKTISVVVLGKKGVGKTSLIESFNKDSNYYPPASGVGIDFKMIIYNSVKIQIYDIPGDLGEEDLGILRNQIQNVKTAILAFDLSEQNTLTELSIYKELINQIQLKHIIIVGCKSDMAEQYDETNLHEAIQGQGFQIDRIVITSSQMKQGQTELLNKILEVNKVQIQTETDPHDEGYCCGFLNRGKTQK